MSTTRRTSLPHVVAAFFRIGWLEAKSYPIAFVMARLNLLGALAVFVVLGGLIADDPGEYVGFVVIGLATAEVLDAAAHGVGNRIDQEISTGRFETYFVEPVPLSMIPVGIVQFELLSRTSTAGLIVLVSVPLGASYVLSWGVLAAVGLVLLGVVAVLGIAIAGSALRILTKRSDPLLAVYSLAARFLGGVYFPISELPEAMRPLSLLIPHSYVTSAVRDLVLRPSALTDSVVAPWVAAVALVVIACFTLPVGLLLFATAVRTGRRLGLLSGY